jgi:hypothetical protein
MKYLDVFTDMTHEHSESSMKQPIVTVHTLLNILLLLVFSVLPGLSIANKPANITPAEMALLPSYCRDTQGFGYGDAYYNTSPNAPKWVAMMGKDFWHMHHYCWALINIRRSERASLSENEKLALRKSALGVFGTWSEMFARTSCSCRKYIPGSEEPKYFSATRGLPQRPLAAHARSSPTTPLLISIGRIFCSVKETGQMRCKS